MAADKLAKLEQGTPNKATDLPQFQTQFQAVDMLNGLEGLVRTPYLVVLLSPNNLPDKLVRLGVALSQ